MKITLPKNNYYTKPKPKKSRGKLNYVSFKRMDGTLVNFKTRCNRDKNKICDAALKAYGLADKQNWKKGQRKLYGSERYGMNERKR